MTFEEFEKQLKNLTTQFQEKENWGNDEDWIRTHKETLISQKIVEILTSNPDAIKLLLNEFVKVKGCEGLKDVNVTDKTSVVPEVQFNKGEDKLDIVINIGDEKGTKIFIENKIHAIDQKNQLWRYAGHNPNYLFYLTRFGHKASNRSEERYEEKKENSRPSLIEGKDYFCVSYYEHIYRWLRNLQKEYSQNKNNQDKYKRVAQLLLWVIQSFVSSPEIFELILENKDYVKMILDNPEDNAELAWIIKYGCGKNDNENNNCQGFLRFNNFVVWTKLFPTLEKFATENECKLIVSDRFEFKNKYQNFIFQTLDNPRKSIKFRLDKKRSDDDTWDGVSLNGKLLTHSKWDFQTLLNYEDGLLKEIKDKVKEEISKM